jgi:hypothetical protein
MGSTNFTPHPLKWLTPPLKKIWRPRMTQVSGLMRLSTLLSTQPCISGKGHHAKHNYFSRGAFLGHRPGSNPQPIELCANIGQVHLMLI